MDHKKHFSCAVLGTFAAVVVFYAPIAAIQALFYLPAGLSWVLSEKPSFYAFTYLVPAVLGAGATVGARLMCSKRIENRVFAAHYVFPASALMAVTALIGRYHADESAIFIASSLAAYLFIKRMTRRSHVETTSTVPDAGVHPREERLSQ